MKYDSQLFPVPAGNSLVSLSSKDLNQVRALFRKMGLSNQADDLLQDSYMKAMKSGASFRGDSAYSTWFYRLAKRIALDHLRSVKRKPLVAIDCDAPGALELLEGVDTEGDPEALAIARERMDRLKAEFAKLPLEVQVALGFGEGVNVAQAASMLGTTNAAIHSRVSRLRKKLAAG